MRRSRLALCLFPAFLGLFFLSTPSGIAQSHTCPVTPAKDQTDAEKAFLKADYETAVKLYQAQLQTKPNDPELTAQLSQVLLRQQKVKEADTLVQEALVSSPKSVILQTALGEIQYREGTPWLAGDTATAAMKMDPCYAPLRLLLAKILELNSYYSAAAKEVKIAHMLDPHNAQIRLQWLHTLPLQQRIVELESYLAAGSGDDAETVTDLRFYLEFLKRQLTEPHKSCRLVSDQESVTVPFAQIMYDPNHIRAFGLEVKLNGHSARLQIDTGASGLIISRSVAERAGLKQFSRTEIGGIGSQGRKSGYTAYVDEIKIGSLEFRDCAVEVIDRGNVVDLDGLIGADVFSDFLVTLDYPTRKLHLNPLPKRPDQPAPSKPSLETAGNGSTGSTGTDSTDKTQGSSAGPRDRYIAPEMKDWAHLYRIGHNLLLPASLNGSKPKMFIIDTGSSSTSISPEVAREVTKVHIDSDTTVQGISGKVDKVFKADRITFKFAHISQQVEDVVSFSTDSISKSLDMNTSGLIGITALGYLKIDIDYRDGLMNFQYDPEHGFNIYNR
ncbi:MAG TPA: aspartyl protease family protein [Edaphobacter sp.]|nr:aspartyl protease family protein [Edaphobacter sp.]